MTIDEINQNYQTALKMHKQIEAAKALEASIRYIEVDETHRIEVMPSGNFYPQRASQNSRGWSYYWASRNLHKGFRTEDGARKFLSKQQ